MKEVTSAAELPRPVLWASLSETAKSRKRLEDLEVPGWGVSSLVVWKVRGETNVPGLE